MAKETNIEWANSTWNPVSGCTKVSPGCDNCYAEAFAERFRGKGAAYPNGFDPTMKPHKLGEPLSRRDDGVTYFVNSMSDLFHREFPNEYIAAVFGVMAASQLKKHQFQVLTKRPERALAFFRYLDERVGWNSLNHAEYTSYAAATELRDSGKTSQAHAAFNFNHGAAGTTPWPLSNVWMGVSIENERVAAPRLEALRQIPAAIRFVSAEPLLGPLGSVDFSGIDWVIIGGESGPNSRPMEVTWALEVIAAARAAGAAVFVKQLGEHWAKTRGAKHKKGGDPEEWPAELRIREFPKVMSCS